MHRDVSWVNIWKDDEAAAFVEGRRGGFQTVPTVVTGGGRLVDPTPAAVRDHLAAVGG